MTGKERMLQAIQGRRPDRIPVWTPHFDEGFVRRWREWKSDDAAGHPLDHYRNDTAILAGDDRFFPTQAGILRREGEYEIRDNGWGAIVRQHPGGYFSQALDRKLKEPGDLDRLFFDAPTLPARYAGLDQAAERARQDGKCAFSKIGGLYVRGHFLRGEDALLMDMAVDEKFCEAFFDRVADHLEGMALETLARTKTYDIGLFIYDDLAGNAGPMFSPAMFERYLLPRYRRIIGRCREAGCRHFFFHSDGRIEPLIGLLLASGFEGINPLEPRCNPALPELRQKYGGRLMLIGGLCNTRILPRNDAAEIRSHLRPLLELAWQGGVALGMASVPAEMPPAAYDYAMRLIEEGAC